MQPDTQAHCALLYKKKLKSKEVILTSFQKIFLPIFQKHFKKYQSLVNVITQTCLMCGGPGASPDAADRFNIHYFVFV
jgi:hypothetical protein